MTLIPDKLNFVIWQGATFRTRLTVYTDAAGQSARDLTGFTASLKIREAPRSPNLLLSLVSPSDLILGGMTGAIDIIIPAAVTAEFTWTVGYYDLRIAAPNGGDTDALVYGTFAVKGA